MPEHLRSYVESIPITEGVRSLESLLEDKTVEMFRLTWSGDAVAAASLTVYRGFECQTAWRQVSKNGIVHLLDTVRNRLLSFVLELQELYPAIIESEAAIS